MPGHHADQRPAWDLYKSTCKSTVLPSPVHSGATPGHHADQRPAWDLYKSTSGEYSFTIPGALRCNARTPRRSKTSLGSLQIYQSTVLPSPVHSGAMPGHHADQRPAWELYKSTCKSTVLPSPVHSGATPGHHADQRPARDLYKSTSLTVQFHHSRCTQAQCQDTTQIKDQLGNSTNLLVRVQFYHPRCTQAQRQDTMQIKDQLGISTNLPVESTVLPSPVHSGATPGHHADQRPARDLYKSTSLTVQFHHSRCTQAQCQDTTQIKDQLGISTNLLVRVQFYHPRCTQAQRQDTMQIKDQLGISTNLPV